MDVCDEGFNTPVLFILGHTNSITCFTDFPLKKLTRAAGKIKDEILIIKKSQVYKSRMWSMRWKDRIEANINMRQSWVIDCFSPRLFATLDGCLQQGCFPSLKWWWEHLKAARGASIAPDVAHSHWFLSSLWSFRKVKKHSKGFVPRTLDYLSRFYQFLVRLDQNREPLR